MKNNKEKREPLLYIHQPKFVFPEPVMQSTYHTKNQPERIKEEVVEGKQADKEQNNPIHEAVKTEELVMEDTKKRKREITKVFENDEPLGEEAPETSEQPVWMGMRPVKRFHDMEMDEKLQHLASQFTKLPCVFDCGSVIHRGILREVTPDLITIETLKNETVTVERKELKYIRLLGPF
ncbi:CotO family spore coat protein [Pseudobacillus wudalianchiensis]|uniref:Spore coat protein CotO n=1 Tax=Pseudobacillus wudalianchiensis TaxID=1743143 RepID=A0A1B9ATT9_9BACI|nr:CotO family spore coat protein [Bacillus wudalianchiensis]OCA87345.1 hypothetical protein A8F95_08880 [Bacillus wudalianchiensis]